MNPEKCRKGIKIKVGSVKQENEKPIAIVHNCKKPIDIKLSGLKEYTQLPVNLVNQDTLKELRELDTGKVIYKQGYSPCLAHIYVNANNNFPTGANVNDVFKNTTNLPNFSNGKTGANMGKLVSEGGYFELKPTN